MKKIICGLMMVIVLVAAMATANAGGLMDYVTFGDFTWISENFIFENPEDNYTNVVDDSVYVYGDNMTLNDECIGLTDKEVEEKISKEGPKEGLEDPVVFVKTMNEKVTVIYIYTKNDINQTLKDNGIIDEGVNQEIHNFNIICWRDYASME